jgi:hypothetical protein
MSDTQENKFYEYTEIITRVYRTPDGKVFADRDDAVDHFRKHPETPMMKFGNMWGVKSAVDKYGLDHYGIWIITGENGLDSSGPNLGKFQGTLGGIINKVLSTLPRFINWGSGGRVELAEPDNVRVIE